jgi:hypothetical protein
VSDNTPLLDGQDIQAAPVERIKVELSDYANAVSGDRYNCALVWAIRRKHPEARRVQVDTKQVGFSIGEQRFVYPSTDEIVDKVIRPLDTGGEVAPCTIRLSDGYVKPVQHTDVDGLQRKNATQRTKTADKRRKGEDPYTPNSARYRRLTVVVRDEN